jgi:hypothetical protein
MCRTRELERELRTVNEDKRRNRGSGEGDEKRENARQRLEKIEDQLGSVEDKLVDAEARAARTEAEAKTASRAKEAAEEHAQAAAMRALKLEHELEECRRKNELLLRDLADKAERIRTLALALGDPRRDPPT